MPAVACVLGCASAMRKASKQTDARLRCPPSDAVATVSDAVSPLWSSPADLAKASVPYDLVGVGVPYAYDGDSIFRPCGHPVV